MRRPNLRPRFSLRTLLLLSLLAASGAALWRNWAPWSRDAILRGHSSMVDGAHFSSDSKFLATTGSELCVWNVESRNLLMKFRSTHGWMWTPRFTKNGHWLNASNGYEILLFDTRTWIAVGSRDDEMDYFDLTPEAHAAGYRDGDFPTALKWPADYVIIPDEFEGKIVCGGNDGRASLELANPPGLIQFLGGHEKAVCNGVFSPDGEHIATFGADKTVHVWSRRRPEWWWGVAWLPEFWLTVVFAGAVVWSLVRDRRELRTKAEAASVH